MIRYQPNNILFRIASSDAISKFKSQQANSFIQLSRRDLAFDTSAREVVLLEYDHFSQWLYRIERICMAAQEGQMPLSLCNAIQESFREEIRTIEIVLESHTNVFNPTITSFVKIIHSYSMNVLLDRMEASMFEKVDKAFGKVVGTIADYLQHVLMCLHEINNNVINNSAQPFICIANFCTQLEDFHRFYPMAKRLEFFKTVGCGNKYVLKNYSGDQNESLFEEAKSYLEPKGIILLDEDYQKVRAYA